MNAQSYLVSHICVFFLLLLFISCAFSDADKPEDITIVISLLDGVFIWEIL